MRERNAVGENWIDRFHFMCFFRCCCCLMISPQTFLIQWRCFWQDACALCKHLSFRHETPIATQQISIQMHCMVEAKCFVSHFALQCVNFYFTIIFVSVSMDFAGFANLISIQHDHLELTQYISWAWIWFASHKIALFLNLFVLYSVDVSAHYISH